VDADPVGKDPAPAPASNASALTTARCATPGRPPAQGLLIAQHIASGSAARVAGTVTIPVYFHVIRQGSGVSNGDVLDSTLDLQIGVLNATFGNLFNGANTPFRFVKAGTTRDTNSAWYTMTMGSAAEAAAKSALHVGGQNVLNVYTTNTASALGWATFPWDFVANPSADGVVIKLSTLPLGNEPDANLGYTLTHEVGHWLGLWHTFEGGCTGGDAIGDTPDEAARDAGFVCPPLNPDTCPTLGVDPIHNYMDYSNDACMFEFTAGQSDRVDSTYSMFRAMPIVDFNLDGQEDVVWHNGATGQTQVWFMSGATRGPSDYGDFNINLDESTGWRIDGINDFNQDGRPDVLWHNGATGAMQVWFMNNTTRGQNSYADVNLSVADSTGWRISGTADFNQDGAPDILWHNGATGVTQIWYMSGPNGTTRGANDYDQVNINVADSTGWRLAGTNDFNQDGKPDLVWHNGTTGVIQIWYMNGANRPANAFADVNITVADSTGWKLVGTDDFNRDGKPDLLWHNGGTGASQVWYMNGAVRPTNAFADFNINVADSTGWKIVNR